MAASPDWLAEHRFLAPIAIAVALVMAWLSASVHLARGCAIDDTPYLGLCAAPPDPLRALRERIATNPGDTPAYLELARTDPSPARSGELKAAARLAPTHPQVQMMQAADAIQHGDVAQAVPSLVALAEYHGSDEAALALARLVVAGQGDALQQQLRPGHHWVEQVLAQMPNAGGRFTAALPLVARALEKKALDPAAVSAYIAQLKAAHAWADAYSLWLVLHGHPLPMLYNGSFDQPFIPNAFDWEVNMPSPASRVGAVIDRSGAEGRGAVLDIRFTGRSIAIPMVRQVVFVGPGRHRLHGDYKASQLRIEQGLTWTVRCIEGANAIAGRSANLVNTDNTWQPFDFEFTVPADCGLVALLELDTPAAVDAAVGARGRVWFDAMRLERLPR